MPCQHRGRSLHVGMMAAAAVQGACRHVTSCAAVKCNTPTCRCCCHAACRTAVLVVLVQHIGRPAALAAHNGDRLVVGRLRCRRCRKLRVACGRWALLCAHAAARHLRVAPACVCRQEAVEWVHPPLAGEVIPPTPNARTHLARASRRQRLLRRLLLLLLAVQPSLHLSGPGPPVAARCRRRPPPAVPRSATAACGTAGAACCRFCNGNMRGAFSSAAASLLRTGRQARPVACNDPPPNACSSAYQLRPDRSVQAM